MGLTGIAFGGLAACAESYKTNSSRTAARSIGYGPLIPDPKGLLDLPEGFSYRLISSFGDTMDDGLLVPDNADGMGCFRLDDSRIALVRNHELKVKNMDRGPKGSAGLQSASAYDALAGDKALPGGTTTLVLNAATLAVEAQYLSLAGTIRNCAGGITPWGSWLSCEEDTTRAGEDGVSRDHGWVFEVPAAHRGLASPNPLTAMGRFNHEAACVDPGTGIVYMTEDRGDSLFYRFIPNMRGALAKGGRLQALALDDGPADTRNWKTAAFSLHQWTNARWIDLKDVNSPEDDLRQRGATQGAAVFARGEGIWFGKGELYFTCTNGGAAQLGQIMRYRPSPHEGQPQEASSPGQLALFLESGDTAQFNYGDNLTIAPHGHLIVCEDQYTAIVDNHLRGVTPDGQAYPFARVRVQTEPAGACFSPDGSTLFVNLFSPGKTLAIRGPWQG